MAYFNWCQILDIIRLWSNKKTTQYRWMSDFYYSVWNRLKTFEKIVFYWQIIQFIVLLVWGRVLVKIALRCFKLRLDIGICFWLFEEFVFDTSFFFCRHSRLHPYITANVTPHILKIMFTNSTKDLGPRLTFKFSITFDSLKLDI